MESNKNRYKIFCDSHPDIPLFSQYWWMDAACIGKTWDVLLVEKSGEIIATMPYLINKKLGFKYILQPQLTQTNGVYICYPIGQSENERLSFEKMVCSEIIAKLEKTGISFFLQNFHHKFTNWLPFFWKGFSQTTRYTYLIENIKDLNKVFKNFSPAKQRQIRKAQKVGITIDSHLSAEEFYDFHCKVLKQKGENNLNSKEVELSIIKTALQHGNGVILTAKDLAGNLHSALFLVWDNNSAYYLIPATDVRFRSSGASTLIVYEAIRYVQEKCISFDFEGSMSENIENSYKQFGTKQIPYHQIKKSYNFLFKMRDIL
jgi:lipid II:glycine glycyltransferase (peptidoglycan interpeptide bridge formation enzyme)